MNPVDPTHKPFDVQSLQEALPQPGKHVGSTKKRRERNKRNAGGAGQDQQQAALQKDAATTSSGLAAGQHAPASTTVHSAEKQHLGKARSMYPQNSQNQYIHNQSSQQKHPSNVSVNHFTPTQQHWPNQFATPWYPPNLYTSVNPFAQLYNPSATHLTHNFHTFTPQSQQQQLPTPGPHHSRRKGHSPAYLALTNSPPNRLPQRQPLLLVLDLNGTLLSRSHSKRSLTTRPGLAKFLNYCFTEHVVVFWTSATPPSLDLMLSRILTDPAWNSRLAARWGRDTFGLTKRQYDSKIEVVKDLDQVWWSRSIQARHPWRGSGWSWGVGNTVLLDDTVAKAKKQPWNLVQMPEYDGKAAEEKDDSWCLARVRAFLEELRGWDNVAAHMRRSPLVLQP